MSDYRCECAECDGWIDEPYLPLDVAPAPRAGGIRGILEAMGKLGGAQCTPVGNNALEGRLGADEGEPVPELAFIEFDMPVPDETGTRQAPADNEAANPRGGAGVPCADCRRDVDPARWPYLLCTTATA